MNLEQQVISLELAKKLNELGVEQESLFYWVNLDTNWVLTIVNKYEYIFNFNNNTSDILSLKHYSAFTVAELGEMLPPAIDKYYLISRKADNIYLVYYEDYPQDYDIPYLIYFEDKKEADARAKMLIYLLENKLIECST